MTNGPGYYRPDGGGIPRDDDPLQRAMLALNRNLPNDAERIASEVLKANPRHTRALYIFASALLMQGRPRDAIAPLETAARGRHDPEVETLLAIALRQAGRQDDAVSQLKRVTKRRPTYGPAFHEFGSLLASLGRHDEAIEIFRRGLEVAPMMPELSIQLGNAFLQRRNCTEAKGAFARALQIAPASADALFGMAKAHQEIGEAEAAAGYFRRYLMIRPDDANVWLNLGQCLLELRDLDAGYECFRTAARGDPKRYGNALSSLVKSGRGKFWLKPSEAARFVRGTKD
jgi:tetratricopeptide (TPR) repeat protein